VPLALRGLSEPLLYYHYTITILSLFYHFAITILLLYYHYTHYTITILSLYNHYTFTILSLYYHYTITIRISLCYHYTITIAILQDVELTCVPLALRGWSELESVVPITYFTKLSENNGAITAEEGRLWLER
jgi:hypothetical protein